MRVMNIIGLWPSNAYLGGRGVRRSAFFRIFRIFFRSFLGRSLSVMFKRKHFSSTLHLN